MQCHSADLLERIWTDWLIIFAHSQLIVKHTQKKRVPKQHPFGCYLAFRNYQGDKHCNCNDSMFYHIMHVMNATLYFCVCWQIVVGSSDKPICPGHFLAEKQELGKISILGQVMTNKKLIPHVSILFSLVLKLENTSLCTRMNKVYFLVTCVRMSSHKSIIHEM